MTTGEPRPAGALRVMADYDCFPLWRPDGGGDLDPSGLPIGAELTDRLLRWAAGYDATLNRDDPAASGFPSRVAEYDFYADGETLARLLARELGPAQPVVYFDGRRGCDIPIAPTLDEDRFDRYEAYLLEVLDLLGLEPPAAPTGEGRIDTRVRRHWQHRITGMIKKQPPEALSAELFEPLVRCAVYEQDPSFTARPLWPALAAFGRRRVQERLIAYVRTGSPYEIGGAADAWYCSWFGEDDPDRCADLRVEFQGAGLDAFLAHDDLRMRCKIVRMLNLRAAGNPPALRPAVAEVLRIAHEHPDDTILSCIRGEL